MKSENRVVGLHLFLILPVILLCAHSANAQQLSITPSIEAGYKHINLNLNVPSPSQDALIDLYTRDASCLTGSVGIAGQSNRLFGAVAIEATAPRDIDVITPENEQWSGRPLPFKWPGTGFSTWNVDGTIGWLVGQQWGAMAGLRYDHLTVALGMPTDGAGAPLIGAGINATFGGDLKVKNWIPYLGVKLIGSNYSATLLYSPIVSTTAITSQSGGGPTGPASYELNSWEWNINGTGSFAEAAMDYSAFSASNVTCSIWGKATWMKIAGNGQWTGLVQGDVGPRPDNDSDAGLCTRNDLAIGIMGQLNF